ncbi:MAG: hypothetical protein KAY37_09675 [Phycisphaerae bacterium]|nr:hypothetical protein [Phycisphaerae bacterium]
MGRVVLADTTFPDINQYHTDFASEINPGEDNNHDFLEGRISYKRLFKQSLRDCRRSFHFFNGPFNTASNTQRLFAAPLAKESCKEIHVPLTAGDKRRGAIRFSPNPG